MRTRLGLRSSLVLRVLLPVFLVLGGATALILFTLEREVETQMKEDVELVARGLRLPVLHAIQEGQEGTLSQALRSALDIRRMYSAHVFGPEGQHLATFGPAQPEEIPQRLAALVRAGEDVGEYGQAGGLRVYSYFVPLSDAWGQSHGVLQLTRRRSDIDDSIRALRLQAGGLLALGLGLVSVLLLRGHHRAVGRPLEGIMGSMERVGAGDRAHRAREEGPRELADVARHFNSMLEAMNQAEAEVEARRAAQAELEQELAQSEKLAAVGELAGGVAHELGSPLSVIDGTAQRLLRRGDLAPDGARRLEAIRSEVERMEDIIRQLLEFGRRESGRTRRVRLADAVRGAVAGSSEQARIRGVRVEVGGATPGPELEADPRRLENAVANLVTNACHAAGGTDGGGRVRVSWGVNGPPHCGTRDRDGSHHTRWAVLEVEDDGPGVPPEIASRIFEPFFTTKGTGEGTGLGLAVVRGVARGLGGAVEVDRSPLGGARFRLLLPLDGLPHERGGDDA